jgi:hypothetical protein
MSDSARRILLAIQLLGVTGIIAELLLMGHVEDVYQLIPIALGAATIVTAAVVAARPGRGSVRLFQVVMALMILGGMAGAWLHFQVNMEFQLEMDASLTGWNLFRKSIVAKSPPALAAGAMIQLGLIGLAYTYKHPATTGERS